MKGLHQLRVLPGWGTKRRSLSHVEQELRQELRPHPTQREPLGRILSRQRRLLQRMRRNIWDIRLKLMIKTLDNEERSRKRQQLFQKHVIWYYQTQESRGTED